MATFEEFSIFTTRFQKGKMVFANLKNFFAKLIFSRQIFFCSERFPFTKIPTKVLAGKKSTWQKSLLT
jgi:hypothetical protein